MRLRERDNYRFLITISRQQYRSRLYTSNDARSSIDIYNTSKKLIQIHNKRAKWDGARERGLPRGWKPAKGTMNIAG